MNNTTNDNSAINSENKISKIKKVDFSIKKHMAFKFMYNGKNYDGLVVQNHSKNTIEQIIFDALITCSLIEDVESCDFARCGRTDAGVSSTGNIFSIYLRDKIGGIDYIKFLNNLLPDDILIVASAEVDESFDARFSCIYREYKYFFMRQNMNLEKMRLACKKLEGLHNFKNFCKIDKSDKNYLTKNYERRIYEFKIDKMDNFMFAGNHTNNMNNITNSDNSVNYFDMFIVTIQGSAFLWHQVRCMMEIIFLIGKGLEDLDIIDHMFDINSDKTFNYGIASEAPLVLSNCQFEAINFESKIENLSENFFSIEKIYQQNLTQVAINSFFFRNVVDLMRPHIKNDRENENDSTILDDENKIALYVGNKYRRKTKYTKLLNHKANRTKK